LKVSSSEVSPQSHKVHNVARNSIYHFSGQVFSKGFFFLTTVYLARKLGASEYGQFAFAYGLVTLLSVLTKFGLDLLTSSDVGEKPERAAQYFTASLIIRMSLSAILFVVLLLFVPVLKKGSEVNHLIFLLATAMVFQSVAGASTSLFEAFQSFGYRSILNLFMFGFVFCAVLIVNHQNAGLIRTGHAFAAAALIYSMIAIILCERKITKFGDFPGFSFLKELFQKALPLGLSEIFIGIYYRADTVLLSLFDTDNVVGWYDAAYTFVYGLRLLPVSVAMVLLPGLSRTFSEDEKEGIRSYKLAIRYSAMAGFLLTFLVAAFSGFCVRIVFGRQYEPSSDVLPILIWTCAIMFINAFQGIFLVISRQRNAFFQATAVGALSNIFLNLVLIPKYSMYGAAWATVISEFFVFLISADNLSRYVPWKNLLSLIAPPAISIAVMEVAWIVFHLEPTWILLALSVAVYLLFVRVLSYLPWTR